MTEPAISQFVGRAAELQYITELLTVGGPRLITLLGPGGIGKTTLATEALHRYQRAHRDHVWWVRLARLESGCDTDTIAEEIVRVVAPSHPTGRRAHEFLFGAFATLDTRRPILVLDNCEHVLPAVAPLIVELLTRIPEVTVLTTSREPIGWTDEQLVPVPSLTNDHALVLFRRRAELTGNPIPGETADLDVAAGICRRVDNNPLFIRLAAARLRYRPAIEVLSDLAGDDSDARLDWSSGVRAGADRRHRSVGDVIAWSYGLCHPDERLLLERMSVFAAGFDPGDDTVFCGGVEYGAIAAVCADDELPEPLLAAVLQRLVDRSLVAIRMSATSASYFLPESVRVFARGRVRARDRHAPSLPQKCLQARHRRYFRDKVVAGRSMLCGPDEARWIEWVRSSWDDILLAIETGPGDSDEAVIGLEIATAVLGERGYAEALRRGMRLRPERNELQHYFLGQLFVTAGAGGAEDARWQELSPAERDIAILVAAGWTNSAVSSRRGTSVRTVDAQVAAIRRKLSAADRSAIIHRIPGELRDRVRLEARQ